jgi:hypothetical protein
MNLRRRFESLMLWVVGLIIAAGLWQMYGLWLFGRVSNDA